MSNINILRSLLPAHSIAMLTSNAQAGALHSRPLRSQEFDDHGHFWFVVDPSADWVAALAGDGAVNLSFTDDEQKTWVSIAGVARVVDDAKKLEEFMSESSASRLDPDTAALLEVRPETVQYWDSPANTLQSFVVKSAEFLGLSASTTIGRSGRLDL